MPLPESLTIGFIGPPRSGKTDLALRKLMDFGPAYLRLAVDSIGDLPSTLHDGQQVPLLDRSTERIEWIDRLELHNLHKYPIFRLTLDADSALAWAQSRARHDRPVVLYVDEAVDFTGVDPNRISRFVKRFLAKRRHGATWLLWGCQYPRQIHYSMFSLVDGLFLFRLEDEDDLRQLRKGGVPQRVIDALPGLHPHEALYLPRLSTRCDPIVTTPARLVVERQEDRAELRALVDELTRAA